MNLNGKDVDYYLPFKNGAKSQIVLWRMDGNGKKEMVQLFPSSSGKLKLMPYNCDKVDTNELIFYAIEKKSYKFGRLRFN